MFSRGGGGDGQTKDGQHRAHCQNAHEKTPITKTTAGKKKRLNSVADLNLFVIPDSFRKSRKATMRGRDYSMT